MKHLVRILTNSSKVVGFQSLIRISKIISKPSQQSFRFDKFKDRDIRTKFDDTDFKFDVLQCTGFQKNEEIVSVSKKIGPSLSDFQTNLMTQLKFNCTAIL